MAADNATASMLKSQHRRPKFARSAFAYKSEMLLLILRGPLPPGIDEVLPKLEQAIDVKSFLHHAPGKVVRILGYLNSAGIF